MSIPRFLLAALFVLAALLPMPPQASAVTDEEKRKAFLKTDRGDSSGETDSSDKSSGKKAMGKEKSGEEPASKPAKSGKKKPKNSKAKPKPAVKKRHPRPEPEETPTPRRTEPEKQPTPAPMATPAPVPVTGSMVQVEKSGLVEEEPAPEAEPRKWWWPFGHAVRYKYLTHSVRMAIDDAHVASHRWRYIVVHNSGTRQGNAKAFDYYHRHVRKMPNGLAYHFVIGNGTSSGNGAIEIGPRWVNQINGGHVHSDYLNSIALGICLVGDYNHEKPTRQQLEALDELIGYLRKRVGKTDHKLAIVKPHRDINPPQWPTDCPGDRFPYDWLEKHFGEKN